MNKLHALAVPATTLALLTACMGVTIEHARRIDPGGKLAVKVQISAEQYGEDKQVHLCTDLPEGWSIAGKVTYEGTDGDAEFSGKASEAPAELTTAVLGERANDSSRRCFVLPNRTYSASAKGHIALNVQVPKSESGDKTLRWHSGYDKTTWAERAAWKTSTVFVGTEKQWGEDKLADNVRGWLLATTESVGTLTSKGNKADAWLKQEGQLDENDLKSAKSEYLDFDYNMKQIDALLTEKYLADDDRGKLEKVKADLKVQRDRWKALWPDVIFGVATGAAAAMDGLRDPNTGAYDATKLAQIDPLVRPAFEFIRDFHDKVELNPEIDGLFSRGMQLGLGTGQGGFAGGVSELCLEVCRDAETKAYAHYTLGLLHNVMPETKAQVHGDCHAAHTTFPTGFATWGAERCTQMLGGESWKNPPAVSGAE